MHFYAMSAAETALNLKLTNRLISAIFMLILMFAPFIVRLSEKTGHQTLALAAAYVGYSWMALLLYVVFFLLSFDIYRLVLYFTGKAGCPIPDLIKLSAGLRFYLAVICSACVCAYGYFEARAIRIDHIVIKTDKVATPVKIAQVSDVHIGLIIGQKRIKAIVEAIAREAPDMLVSTGDFVDGQLDGSSEGLAGSFASLHPPLGKYAVTGNHEFYAGLNQSLEFTALCGFKILRNEAVNIAENIALAGVDDPEVNRLPQEAMPRLQEKEILKGIPDDKLTILLKHRPDISEAGLFDLQLSGHTHKGQIFPFSVITWLYYSKQTGIRDFTTWVYIPNRSGLVKIGQRAALYINRGVGTWGPPIRVLSPPEIAIFEIIPK
ncbi:MAG: metallophosphoesterase [Candidatus Magnetominusculus sp. LBB02]|nr:metallophosphoesterase [Candidatus Magnetominusculus sp. LBB02]